MEPREPLRVNSLGLQVLLSLTARLKGYCRIHGLSIDNIDRCIQDEEKETFLFLLLDLMI